MERSGARPWRSAITAVGALVLMACNDTPPEPTRTAPATVEASSTEAAPAITSSAVESAAPPGSEPASSAAVATAPPTAMPPSSHGVLGSGVADQIIARDAVPFVRVTTPGAEPRVLLEYAPAENKTVVIGMRLDLQVAITQGNKPSAMRPPTVGMNLTVRAGKRGAAGVPIHGSIAKVALLGPVPNEEAKKKLEYAVRQMNGMTIDYVLGADGHMSDVKVTSKGEDDGAATQLIDQVRESFSSLVAPLPHEPVGVGATWQAVSRVNSGVDTLQYATYRLRSKTDTKVEIETELQQVAAERSLPVPSHAAPVDLTSFKATGRGTSKIDLALPAPDKSEGTMSTSMTYGSGANEVTMDMAFRIAFGEPLR